MDKLRSPEKSAPGLDRRQEAPDFTEVIKDFKSSPDVPGQETPDAPQAEAAPPFRSEKPETPVETQMEQLTSDEAADKINMLMENATEDPAAIVEQINRIREKLG